MLENKYCIGDVHGCIYTLKALVNRLPKDAEIILLGDLCDKGNFTKEVFEYVIENNFTVIKGNHDLMMEKYLIRVLEEGLSNIWTSSHYGGYKTVDSYRDDLELAKKHIEFISSLPYYLEFERYFLTHGFGLPYYNRKDTFVKGMLSNRLERRFPDWEDYTKSDKINIYGHCDYNKVNYGDNYIGIDTGCVYGRKLTAINLLTKEIIQKDVFEKDIL